MTKSHINSRLSIPDEEVRFTFSRSGGPGGQNVNKVNTRVTLWFDVAGSPSLSEDQRRKILQRLASRINNEGMLQIVSSVSRSQQANREDALERFARLLEGALRQQTKRKKTRVPRRAKERRLQGKRSRGKVKALRKKAGPDD